jgi:hypothetical protein
MSFFKRLEGIFFNPKPVFAGLAEKPVWVGALIVVLIASAVFSLLISPYMQKDQLLMMQDNTKLKEKMGEERFNQMIQSIQSPSKTRILLQNLLFGPLFIAIGILFSCLIIMIMGRFITSQGSYAQILAVVVHAGYIDKLFGNAVRALLILTRKSVVQTTTSLALFFPHLEITSSAYVILAQIDFFQLWTYGVVGLGLAAIFKVDVRKGLFVSYGFWLLKTLVFVAVSLIGMKFLR